MAKEKWKCIVCDDEIDGYEAEWCCDGHECGCQGLPIEPPLCDKQECHDRVYGASPQPDEKE